MSQHKAEVPLEDALSEDDIAEYLGSHPDFFERHEKLLLALRVPHPSSRAAISLVERQVAVLRKRNDQLEDRLKRLVAVAKQNDRLVGRIHSLALGLMRARTRDQVLERLETALREDFSADRATVVLFADAIGTWQPDPAFARAYARDSADLQPFATFMRAARTRCGRLRQRQREVLFGDDDEALGSAAMVPLGDTGRLGFLVVANRNPDHFNPGKSTDFLNRLGELVAVALEEEQQLGG